MTARSALTSLLAIVLGFIAANVLNFAGGVVNAARFPAIARAVEANDPAALSRAIEMTQGAWTALATTLAAWALGSFAGGFVAARFAPRAPLVHAFVVGTCFMLGGVLNNLAFPPPAWFWAATLVAFAPPAWLGGRVAARND